MDSKLRILLVEDVEDDAVLILSEIEKGGYAFNHNRVAELDKIGLALESDKWDLILLDYNLPGFNALDALSLIRGSDYDGPVIVISGTVGEDVAVETMRAGAHDYIMKDNLTRLVPAIHRELREAEVHRAHKRAADRILHLNAVLRAIRNVNRLIVRERDMDRLIQQAVSNLIENRGYYNAWIALLDESGAFISHAEAGLGENFRPMLEKLAGGELPACAELAMAESGVHFISDPYTECGNCPLKQTYENRCALTCRLENEEKIFGFLAVSIPGKFHDVEEESALMQEVAGDIGFALAAIAGEEREREISRKLAHSETRYEQLVTNMSEGVWFIDTEFRTTYVNPAMARMLGYEAAQMIGRHLFSFMDRDKISDAEENIKRRMQGIIEHHDFGFKRKDGSILHAGLEAIPVLSEKGEYEGAFAVVDDRTEQELAKEDLEAKEQQLIQAQKMEAIGRLAGGVAHDFNNMVGAIRAYCDVVLHELSDDAPVKDDILGIREVSDRAKELTKKLLAFGRKQVLKPIVFNLNELILDMERLIRPVAGERIEVVMNLDSDTGVVRADPNQLEQVIMNLVINARDAITSGGRISIDTSTINLDEDEASRIGEVDAGSWVVVSIVDSGEGMDEETLNRAFEPFFTTKKKDRGTGLGLSMVYGILRQSGGHVLIESSPGLGTMVQILLPVLEDDSSVTSHKTPSSLPSGGSERVLVVEDEFVLRKLICRMLRQKGYHTLDAPDGPEAIAIAEEHEGKIDVLLTDVVMPRMSGQAAAERINKIRPDIIIIYMSGYTESERESHAVFDAGTPFLQKPFSADDLASKLREVIDGKSDL